MKNVTFSLKQQDTQAHICATMDGEAFAVIEKIYLKSDAAEAATQLQCANELVAQLNKVETAFSKVATALFNKGLCFDVSQKKCGWYMIGIQGKGVYHWFVDCEWSEGQSMYGTMNFDHTYSQNNGKTNKGWRHAGRVIKAYNKALKADYFS